MGRVEHRASHDPFVTFTEYLSLTLLPIATASSIRKAPSVSFALFLAFIANVGYANGIAEGEIVRWISALVGAGGAVEFGRGVERMKLRMPVSIPDALRKVDVGGWIGLVVLGSMGVDGFGMIVFRKIGIWIVPEATIGILILVVLLGLFGKDKP